MHLRGIIMVNLTWRWQVKSWQAAFQVGSTCHPNSSGCRWIQDPCLCRRWWHVRTLQTGNSPTGHPSSLFGPQLRSIHNLRPLPFRFQSQPHVFSWHHHPFEWCRFVSLIQCLGKAENWCSFILCQGVGLGWKDNRSLQVYMILQRFLRRGHATCDSTRGPGRLGRQFHPRNVCR